MACHTFPSVKHPIIHAVGEYPDAIASLRISKSMGITVFTITYTGGRISGVCIGNSRLLCH